MPANLTVKNEIEMSKIIKYFKTDQYREILSNLKRNKDHLSKYLKKEYRISIDLKKETLKNIDSFLDKAVTEDGDVEESLIPLMAPIAVILAVLGLGLAGFTIGYNIGKDVALTETAEGGVDISTGDGDDGDDGDGDGDGDGESGD